MLQAQTKDKINFEAMFRLKQYGLTIENMNTIPFRELTGMIYKVGYHRRKAKNIKETC